MSQPPESAPPESVPPKETQPEETQPRTRPLYLDRNLLVIFSVTLVAMQGVASITPALPEISRAYGISAHQTGWLVAAFTLSGIFLTPVIGLLSDRFGRKAIILPSLLLFAVAGGACSLQWEFESLVALRVLQGIGGASLNTLTIALIGDLYSGNERATAMGYSGGFTSAAAAGYPLVGGVLVLLGWNYVFVLPLLGLPVAVLVLYALDSPRSQHAEGLTLYLRNMASSLARRETLALIGCSFVVFTVLYGTLVTYMPFYLETEFGMGSVGFGLVLAAHAVGATIGSIRLGALTRRYSRKAILLTCYAVQALCVAALSLNAGVVAVYLLVAATGAAMGIAISTVQVLLSETAAPAQRGGIIAMNGTMFRLGQTVGPLAMGVALTVGGMSAVFILSAVLCALAIPLIVLAVREHAPKARTNT